MTKIEQELENAQSAFAAHSEVCPHCKRYNGEAKHLNKLCLGGSHRYKAILDARHAIDMNERRKERPRELRLERKAHQ